MKYITLSEAETKRHQAIDFMRRMGNDDAADEFEAMTPEEYAEHKNMQLLQNPRRRTIMPVTQTKTKADLQIELDEANDYIEQLEAKLEDIAGIATDEDEDDEDDDDDCDDNGEDEDNASGDLD